MFITPENNQKKNTSLPFPTKKDEDYKYLSMKEHQNYFSQPAEDLVNLPQLENFNPDIKYFQDSSYGTLLITNSAELILYFTEEQKKEIKNKGIHIGLYKNSTPTEKSPQQIFKIPPAFSSDYFSNFSLTHAHATLYIEIPKNTSLS